MISSIGREKHFLGIHMGAVWHEDLDNKNIRIFLSRLISVMKPPQNLLLPTRENAKSISLLLDPIYFKVFPLRGKVRSRSCKKCW